MDLLISGNVQTILQGHVTKKTLRCVFTDQMPYALGGAALPDHDPLSIGETIIYEGVGHIFTVEGSYENNNTLQAAFLMGIGRRPQNTYHLSQSQTINSLYEELIKSYPEGFAIAGTALFSKLFVAYLKRSPIYGENVNTLHDKYWHNDELGACEAKLFGVVLRKPDPRAFYNNPNEEEAPTLPSHTHVLMPEARHLLTHSLLEAGLFSVEAITDIKTL